MTNPQVHTIRVPNPFVEHQHRLGKIVAILEREGERTVYEIAKALFGEMKSFHVILGCAEANAHLETLLEQGRVSFAEGTFRLT